MKWHESKWPILQAANKDLPVVIPLGSIEQHGHHLPLCTDTTQVSAIADQVEERLRDRIFMLPVLWLGSSHHHMDFPGTISVRPTLYSQMICDVTTSILNAGFRRLFFLNGHGGNETPAAQALTELSDLDSKAGESLLALANWWSVGKPEPRKHLLQSPAVSHACEYETSLMLLLRPDLVDKKQIVDVDDPIDSPWLTGEKRVALFRRFSLTTTRGNMGKSTAGTAEKGNSILNAVADDVVAFLEEFAKWPLPKKLGPGK